VRDAHGRPVGRIAVLEHRPHNAYRGAHDALLYLYEAIDDDRVAGSLFEAAEGWARARGLGRLVGPKGFMTGDGLGLLVEGFDLRPAFGIPYNPPYYARQWEQVGGMQKEVDYVSGILRRETFSYPERLQRLVEKVKIRMGFHVPDIRSRADLMVYAERLKEAYNSAFVTVWSYTPIPDGELETIVKRLFTFADPRLIKLIFKGEELAGFTLAYPDISAALHRTKGELWPFGWLAILLEKNRTDYCDVNGNAVLPKFQGMGANVLLYDNITSTLIHSRFQAAELIQVQETNVRMMGDLVNYFQHGFDKRHRVYSRSLG